MGSQRNRNQRGSSSRLSPEGVLGILDAFYQVERAPALWVDGILEAIEPTLARDAGIGAILYDIVSDTEFRIDAIRGRGLPPGLLQAGADAYRDPRTWPSMVSYYRSHLCDTLNEPVADSRMQTHYAGSLGGQFIINGADGSGKGCAIHVFSSRSVGLAGSQLEVLRRIAVHLATAYRLQQRLRANAEPPAGTSGATEAVLTSLGRVEHAEGQARSSHMRRELALAVRQRESILSANRYGAEGALRARKGLVAARWTLVDDYVHAGRRYVLARENEPSPRGLESLSRREQQVAVLAAHGRSNKLIAYELGLAHSTVRVLVTRACAKLGVGSRSELVVRVTALQSGCVTCA